MLRSKKKCWHSTKKFHDFIYGRPVTVETDHQPLITILRKPLHMASPRLQGMIMKLHHYHLDVIFKRGKELFVADALSRAYLSSFDPQLTDDLLKVMTVQVLSSHRIDELRAAVQKDVTCQQLSDMIRNGWPATSKELPYSLPPFFSMRDELTIQDDLLLRGERFIIPPVLQKLYVGQLHQGHPDIAATKRRAKETMYWPSMYIAIDTEISRCAPCNALKLHQAKEPLQLHEIPDLPWSFTAADLFDWHGKTHLVLLDSFSGWFELDYLSDMRSSTVIAKLKINFSVHGIPHTLMTDNATQFVCKDFAHTWDFKHVRSSPHYPQSNGLAECAVRSAKHLLEKCYCDQTDIRAALLHNLPRDDLPSPAQCLFSRQTQTFLLVTKPLLQPVVHTDVKEAITKQRMRGKDYYDRNAHQLPALKPGQTIRMQTARGFDRLAIVNSPAEQPNSYVVTSQGAKYIRNRRHLLYVSESPAADFEDDLPVVTDARNTTQF